jgi:hypothetical protein
MTGMEGVGREVHYFSGWDSDPSFRVRASSEDFWRGLNPELGITDLPFEREVAPFAFDHDTVASAVSQMRQDGYFSTGPVIEPEATERLAGAVLRIVAAGFHPIFLAVYDEFWRPFGRLGNLLEPVLTAPPRVLGDFWVWCVSPQHAPSGWPMHRDRGTHGTVSPDGVPSLLTVWIPFTDATPENGCIRVLPTSRDPELGAPPRPSDRPVSDDVRLLPARAGAILAWNQHLLHGGGPSAPGSSPRISAGVYLQSSAGPSYGTPVTPDAPLPFATRLRLIAVALLRYHELFHFPRSVLRFVDDHVLTGSDLTALAATLQA